MGYKMKEFMTFKSGKFYFSEKYDAHRINALLIMATVLNETVVDLPILPALASNIEPDIMYSSISGTAAIEGNPITKDDVRKLAEGEDIEKYTKKDKLEITNLLKAYSLLSNIKAENKPVSLSESLIRDIHLIITAGIDDEQNEPGQYRNSLVRVGNRAHGGVYTPPKILADIKNLMNEFIEWINSDEVLKLNPFIRAAIAHYHFCLIHPFGNGNGRTGRLIEALLLESAHIKYVPKVLSNFYYRNVDDYYIAFSKTIKLKKDITPFLEFVLRAAVFSLKEIKETIIYDIRRLSLREFYFRKKEEKAITTRQFDLLSLLLDNQFEFTLKDLIEIRPISLLYNKTSVQTARRDIKKLTGLNLLTTNPDGKSFLNLRVLG